MIDYYLKYKEELEKEEMKLNNIIYLSIQYIYIYISVYAYILPPSF